MVTAIAPVTGLRRYLVMAFLVAAGSALVAACAQIKVNLAFTPVPITGQTFAVLTVGGLLGARLGAASLALYMVEGVFGVLWGDQSEGFKVFSDGTFGWRILAGPTGGYIVGFVAAAYIVGWLTERGFDRNPFTATVAMAVGNVTLYVPGLIWLDHHFPGKAFDYGLYPFILGDSAKLLLAAAVLPTGWALIRFLPGYRKAFPSLSGELRTQGYRLPLAWLYIPLSTLVIVGALLPWGEVGGGTQSGINFEQGQFAIAAAGVCVLLSLIALTRVVPWELIRVGQFACGAVAAFAVFFQLADILEARNEAFSFSPLGIGLIVAALGSVAIAAASLLDRNEDQAVVEGDGSAAP
jgi:biotin transport system substrate-specific component